MSIDSETTAANEGNSNAKAIDVINEKMTDLTTPGYQVEFDPLEAEQAGAFVEDAIDEADALASTTDVVDDRE